MMLRLTLALSVVAAVAAPLAAADQISEARRLYNAGQYDAAEKTVRDALSAPATADAARLVLGRIQLERFRQSADPADLDAARDSLRSLDPRSLEASDRVELTIGLGEALYFDDLFGSAAELFESVLDWSVHLGATPHARVLDWWATALDRQAQLRPADERPAIYKKVLERMRAELNDDPALAPASYWLVAAARGSGDLERAWQSAIAGWLRAPLGDDRGAALRADLDRLVTQAIIPERASRLGMRDSKEAQAGMQREWGAIKDRWSK
jgi:hypothetical protein